MRVANQVVLLMGAAYDSACPWPEPPANYLQAHCPNRSQWFRAGKAGMVRATLPASGFDSKPAETRMH